MSNNFIEFSKKVYPYLSLETFHQRYYEILEQFALGNIRKLIVCMPPQHGKSLGSSTLLPAYILGLNPDAKITIASYSASLASRFNRRVQRILESSNYEEIFPETTIKKGASKANNYIRTADHVEIINHSGELYSVGREGSLTGNQVDIFLLDDLYKDASEASSPIIRENCWEWYTSVVKTRMHNDSSELIVFTRWHNEDLIGLIENKEEVIELHNWEQIKNHDQNKWLRINFEAIKQSQPTGIDPRELGEPLWAERHSKELLEQKKRLDPLRFEAMYQGNPSIKEGLLYGDNFLTYSDLPTDICRIGNYTDTADMGDDYLCSFCYSIDLQHNIYITDVVYSRERMEITEQLVSNMLKENNTKDSWIESNNGGRGFARAVANLARTCKIEAFHQSGNKEARILSNCSTVLRHIHFPTNWHLRWSELYHHLITYQRNFKVNRWHDAPDSLTGIIEKELLDKSKAKVKAIGFS